MTNKAVKQKIDRRTSRDISNGVKFTTLGALIIGSIHGYCDSHGISLEHSTEDTLTYLPAIVEASLFGSKSFLYGLGFGCAAGESIDYTLNPKRHLERIALNSHKLSTKGIVGAVVGGSVAVTAGAIFGGALGATKTLIGYGFGYGFGRLMP